LSCQDVSVGRQQRGERVLLHKAERRSEAVHLVLSACEYDVAYRLANASAKWIGPRGLGPGQSALVASRRAQVRIGLRHEGSIERGPLKALGRRRTRRDRQRRRRG
jgi:hypothetical protein